MPKTSEAIRLAEVSDWPGLERLIEKSPEFAKEYGDYGMLPLHWACTESHVPLPLLVRLLKAYPDGVKTKNDADLTPLHIAIRAGAQCDWIRALLEACPEAARIRTPQGVFPLELGIQMKLSKDSLIFLERAYRDGSIYLEQPEDEQFDATTLGDEVQDVDWQAHLHSTERKRTGTMITHLSNGGPLSPGSVSSKSSLLSPREQLISPSSTSTSSNSKDTTMATMPHVDSPRIPPRSGLPARSASTGPPPPLHKQMQGPFHRKHSLDYHAHAAAAAAAAQQQRALYDRTLRNPGRSASLLGARHQSLPVIPSFEHLQQHMNRFGPLRDDYSSSEDSEDNNAADAASQQLSSFHGGLMRRQAHRNRSNKRSYSIAGTRPTPNAHEPSQFESPPEWKRDDECSICRASFGMFKHRHHCRNCGKSICSQHSADKKIVVVAKGFTTPQRVCVTCYAMITHKETTRQQQQHQHQQLKSHLHLMHHAQSTGSGRSSAVNSPMHANRAGAGAGGAAATGVAAVPSPSNDSLRSVSREKMENLMLQAQVSELRQLVSSQQKQLEQMQQSNMQMQQQLLEQEELKAQTMLLITDLMTRVSQLELDRQTQDQQEEEDATSSCSP